MLLRSAILAWACFLSISEAQVSPWMPMPLDQAAKLFGERPSAFAPDLSPSGDKLVYLSAGPGASTVAHLIDLNKRTDLVLARSNGKPHQLH